MTCTRSTQRAHRISVALTLALLVACAVVVAPTVLTVNVDPVAFAQGVQAGAVDAPTARAEIKNAKGETVGNVKLMEMAGGVLLHGVMTGLPPGPHGFHIHAVGKCEAPDFKSAGGHFNPDAHTHGLADPKGAHAGDLPNLFVPMSGRLEFDAVARGVTLGPGPASLMGSSGTSLVVHESADDYRTDPAGNAGARIACGVIAK